MAQELARASAAFLLDTGGRKRRPRTHDNNHLGFIRRLPCLACGSQSMIQAAHIRYGEPRLGKRRTGMSEKPDDKYTVPLRSDDRADQHRENEREWWRAKGIDPVQVAQSLWACTGDDEVGGLIIRSAYG